MIWMRRLLALHQLVYLSLFATDVPLWFAAGPAEGRMVDPRIVFPQVFSILHGLHDPIWSWLVWGAAVTGWILLGAGRLSKVGQVVLLGLQLTLHHANPLIIHEPQQIANFLLVVSLVWPSRSDDPQLPALRCLMIGVVSSYYFLAGVKKLMDPEWLRGDALQLLLLWAPLARSNFLVKALLGAPWLLKLGTWGALIFEIGFPFVAWSRWRRTLIPAALVFHACIWMTLEVGTFGLIMPALLCFLGEPDESGGVTEAPHARSASV